MKTYRKFCNPLRLIVCLLLCCQFSRVNAQEIPLSGTWRFAIDRDDKGITEKWFSRKLADSIHLPGTMTENGKGDEVTLQTKWTGSIYDSSFFFRNSLARFREEGNTRIPFWLTPLKHYVGVAWYQQTIKIPRNCRGQRIQLYLERSHIQTSVWLDDMLLGKANSLVAAHQFTLPQKIKSGAHILTIRIDNRLDEMNVGPDSHSVTDHTQGNWNGIVGKIALETTPPVYIEDVQVYPDVAGKQASVQMTIVNTGETPIDGTLALSTLAFLGKGKATSSARVIQFHAPPHDTTITTTLLQFEKVMQVWDEFSPIVYHLDVLLQSPLGNHKKKTQFGMREIKAVGQDILVNGRKVHLRGDVNNCEFPLTGYAPMNEEEWKKLFAVAKAHGLNHMRFHSWCPPEAAFLAADDAGFYLQPEGPTWPNHGTSLGDKRFIDQYLYEETARIIKAYGNHPSFCFFAAGNEPAGRNQASYLQSFVNYWKARDPRRLYAAAAVGMSWPLYADADYMIKSGPRGLNWNTVAPETVSDYHEKIASFNIPYVTHEMGQWCVFPDFKEIAKYTGVTRARNFELFQSELQAHDMGDQGEDFLMASGKLQAICYKQEIEKSLRTPNSTGFQLLGLQDFPGQGTALIGVLNAFWQEKGYLSSKEWSRFCNQTVPLTRIPRFTYTNRDTFVTAVEVYHYGPEDMQDAVVSWTITDDQGAILQEGQFAPALIKRGGNTLIDSLRFQTSKIQQASRLHLSVKIADTPFMNDWYFWVYPESLPTVAADVYYTDTLDTKAEAILQRGGTVFMNAAGKVVKGKEIVQQFTPVFWNTSWFKMRPPHTLGILLDPTHPAFKAFPTDYHSDLQWWEIVNLSQVMHLEDFPKGFRPLVQPIDTWFMNRKLGLVIAARVGKGRIIISSADLFTDVSRRVAARQLLYSLQCYMASADFNPDVVELSVLRDLFVSPSRERWENFTRQNPDELRPQQIVK